MEAFGAAANIISVIHITAEVIKRLNDFKSTVEGLPRTLKSLSIELPTLNNSLKRIRQAIDDGQVPEESQTALKPLLEDFEQQIRALMAIMDKMRPKNSSNTARNLKAVTSLRYDSEVKYIESVIRGYVSTLTLESTIVGGNKGVFVPKKPLPLPRAVGLSRRDPGFIERGVLDELQANHRNSGSRSALVGIGGIGKSQIAVEFGHRVRDVSEETWVFFVRGATVAKFEESYREMAKAVGMPGQSERSIDTFKTVQNWLSNERNGKWLMIIDNADDLDVWIAPVPPISDPLMDANAQDSLTPAMPRLHSFLPESRNGSILVTSRNREVARLLTGSYPQILQVNEMNEKEATRLFNKKSGATHEHTEVASLVQKLDYIPLAISHAATHIVERARRMTISRYLAEIEGLDSEALRLLEVSSSEEFGEEDSSHSVIETWMISFRYIQATRPSAARLLSLMCLFDWRRIPEDLLRGQYAQEPLNNIKRLSWWRRHRRLGHEKKAAAISEDNIAEDAISLDRDFTTLSNFALIKTEKDGQHFEMHRLVQITTKRWLDLQNKLTYWTSKFIALMERSYPWPEEGNAAWFRCQDWFPHAQMARLYRPSDPTLLRDWGFLLQNAAAYAYRRGLFRDAEVLWRDAVSAWEIAFGKDHSNTLRLLHNLGHTLLSLNRLQEAESMHCRVLASRERLYGPDDEKTLTSVCAMGDVLRDQAKFGDAEIMYRRAMKGREKIHGIMHDDTRLAVMKLANTLNRQGRGDEAWELMARAFPEHTDDVP